jgi:CheY-like chemotaxis protein
MMEGVAGISRPRRRLFPGGGSKARSLGYLPVEYAPLRRKVKRAVRSPSFTARFFHFVERAQVALHEDVDRAMVTESSIRLDRNRPPNAPADHRRRPRVRRLSGQGVSRSRPRRRSRQRRRGRPALADSGDYDVLVVDRMLPKRDGLSLIGTLREKGNEHAGADPLRARPGRRPHQGPARRRRRLSAKALFVRRTAGARRGAVAPPRRPAEETTYRVGDLELDRLSHGQARGKDEIVLQPREFRLLEYLMKHAGRW